MMQVDSSSDTVTLYAAGRHVIAVIDDDPAVLEAVRRLLRSEPYEVWITTHGDDVLNWTRTGAVSLVVADLRLSGASGLDLVREVRRSSSRTVCVLLTGFPSPDVYVDAERAGAREVLTKPWSEEGLRRTVRHLLRERELSGTCGRPAASREA